MISVPRPVFFLGAGGFLILALSPDSSVMAPLSLDTIFTMSLDYALARLEDGKLALVPHTTRAGDDVALLAGSGCPFVVRRQDDGRWKLIGECYVDGMMEGEEWREGRGVGEMEFV